MTGCQVGCGRCCDPVTFHELTWALIDFWRPDGPWTGLPHPAGDWAAWEPYYGDSDEAKADAVAAFDDPDHPHRVNGRFAAAHWTPRPRPVAGLAVGRLLGLVQPIHCDCDKFDRDTRTCTAHDDRPPVCSGFPWYGNDPVTVVRDGLIPVPYERAVGAVGGAVLACSYTIDLPPSMRPGVRPQLPIAPVEGPPSCQHHRSVKSSASSAPPRPSTNKPKPSPAGSRKPTPTSG